MIKRTLPLSIGLSLCAAVMAQQTPAPAPSGSTTQIVTTTTRWGTRPPSGALTEDAIKTAIANAGYKEVKGLKFKDGVWRSKARGGNDQWARITVGPTTGKVYVTDAPSRLNQDEIRARLTAAGYEKIHDVEYEHGLWSADARTAHGTAVDLLVDPDDGSVVASSRD